MEAKSELESMQRDLRRLLEKRAVIDQFLEQAPIIEIFKEIEDDAKTIHAELLICESKDLKTKQETYKALSQLRNRFEDALKNEINAKGQSIKEFKEKNALFIAAQKVEDEREELNEIIDKNDKKAKSKKPRTRKNEVQPEAQVG